MPKKKLVWDGRAFVNMPEDEAEKGLKSGRYQDPRTTGSMYLKREKELLADSGEDRKTTSASNTTDESQEDSSSTAEQTTDESQEDTSTNDPADNTDEDQTTDEQPRRTSGRKSSTRKTQRASRKSGEDDDKSYDTREIRAKE